MRSDPTRSLTSFRTDLEEEAWLEGWVRARAGCFRHDCPDYRTSAERKAFRLGWDAWCQNNSRAGG
jgi:hypothetical protein